VLLSGRRGIALEKKLEITYGYKKDISYRLHVKDITHHIITSKKV